MKLCFVIKGTVPGVSVIVVVIWNGMSEYKHNNMDKKQDQTELL